ncbi:ErfK/YbiS/YcfS/YnhG family protein [Sulfurihydrogenibium azorense Az-Fu1]|uniref:ErfK/YbiS/YcfS/YnhG family protein n=1 Tax=Sulfurihydrogenibium azorense (strain DSM 15241 / OCM 825 / Az-Fu1) TaxID=204536 RepID=C1DWG2_SULAA|nr:L,D-transpeptidase [Sulfurihydrogenibium azorense]ACN99013.1 ErfK/YbiS/YcfS/YnhG family protein [Sulfurihydrogenibium azorense Az-Fu1]
MVKKFLLLLFSITLTSYATEDLFKIAKQKVQTKSVEDTVLKSLKLYNDGLYTNAINLIQDTLIKSEVNDQNYAILNLILASSIYKAREEDLMYKVIQQLQDNRLDDYSLYRIYQIAMTIFIERKHQEGQEYILNKLGINTQDNPKLETTEDPSKVIEAIITGKESKKEKIKRLTKSNRFILFGEDSKVINYKNVSFILGQNIFELDPQIPIIGKLSIYISEKDQTLLEISKKLDLGYYELKNANPFLDPFDIRKNQIIIVPFRRILPIKNFSYGTIYININEKRLYYPVLIEDKSYIITFPIGIGADEAQSPVGDFKITQKRKNPAWYPPESIRKEQPDLPPVFPPGPDNPLGTRAMRLGNTSFLMHGTNKEYGIGMKVSHGCIRMYNEDVEKLFEVVDVGTPVVSRDIPYKVFFNSEKFVEAFDDDSILELEKTSLVSKKFIQLYKTDIIGKSFAIKAW